MEDGEVDCWEELLDDPNNNNTPQIEKPQEKIEVIVPHPFKDEEDEQLLQEDLYTNCNLCFEKISAPSFDRDDSIWQSPLYDYHSKIDQLEAKSKINESNFLVEFGSTELFFIHGDSLVATTYKEDIYPIQLLHSIHKIEKLITDLKMRGGRFRVFFLSEAEKCLSIPQKLFRTMLIYHLQKYSIHVDTIDGSWDSPLFKYLIDTFSPAYIAVNIPEDDSSELALFNRMLTLYLRNFYIVDLSTMEVSGMNTNAFTRAPLTFDLQQEAAELLSSYDGRLVTEEEEEEHIYETPNNAILLEELNESHKDLDSRSALGVLSLINLFNRLAKLPSHWKQLGKSYCVYLALVHWIGINHRQRPITDELNVLSFNDIILPFLLELCKSANQVFKEICALDTFTDIEITYIDLIDSKFFHFITILISDRDIDDPIVINLANSFWEFILKKTNLGKEPLLPIKLSPKNKDQRITQDSLLKVRNQSEVINKTLLPLKIKFLDEVIPDLSKNFREFEMSVENINRNMRNRFTNYRPSHYHSGKEFGDSDPYAPTKDDTIDKERQNRFRQKDEAALRKFSETLQVDSPVKTITIHEDDPAKREERRRRARKALDPNNNNDNKTPLKNPQPSKITKPKKKDQIKEENKTRVMKEKSDILTRKIDSIKPGLMENDPVEAVAKLNKLFKESIELDLYEDAILIKLLIIKRYTSQLTIDERIVEKSFSEIQDLFRAVNKTKFNQDQIDELFICIKKLPILNLEDSIAAHFRGDPFSMTFKPIDSNSNDYDPIKMQLTTLSHKLQKTKGTNDDARVPFTPDDWQVKLLDIVDEEQSALISAPTSSGKTFIAFYVMESILRLDSESVVVFIAPTKALVNQMEANVISLFNKDYGDTGRAVCGTFTRDFRKNVYNCQVLITVPSCLEILLLSRDDPTFAHRLKYVIFDEIHTIITDEGNTLHRLLLTVNVPIIALSATIGNFKEFYQWLAKVENDKGKKLYEIQYTERYNNIQPQLAVGSGSRIKVVPLNPLYSINVHQMVLKRKFPPMKLLPEHCVDLYHVLCQYVKQKDIERISPYEFFKYKGSEMYWNITMRDSIKWENEIKSFFLKLCLDDPKLGIQIVTSFKSPAESFLPLFDSDKDAFEESQKNLMALLRHLERTNQLPGIVFHFDRMGCEAHGIVLCKQLEKAEQNYRASPAFKERLARAYEAVRRAEEDLQKAEFSAIEQSRANDKVNQAKSMVYQLKTQIFPQFAFFPEYGCVEDDELESMIKKKYADVKHLPLYRALKRGIGVHHGGLPKKYRQAVERLFRMKKLRVVIATGTLALGINVPCKTVILGGDSFWLNTLAKNQMEGRAGRRGFDLLGHVVYFGIPEPKIRRLLTSHLPAIMSSAPIDATTCLRIYARYMLWTEKKNEVRRMMQKRKLSNEEDKMKIVKSTRRLLRYPLCVDIPNNGIPHLDYLFRYSFEYLAREGYIDFDGTHQQFCGLIIHIFYHNAPNYVLTSFIREGLFDSMCTGFSKLGDGGKRDLATNILEILAILYNRKRYRSPKFTDKKSSPSKLLLPPLPEAFKQSLQNHNKRALQCISDILNCVALVYSKELDESTRLPLSKLALCKGSSLNNQGELLNSVSQNLPELRIRSIFSSLSGGTEGVRPFQSVGDLKELLREGLFFEETMVPWVNDVGNFNAYLVDFYRHGQLKTITQDNKIRPDEAWECVKDFQLTLKAIASALKVRSVNPKSDPVVQTFCYVAESYEKKFKESQSDYK